MGNCPSPRFLGNFWSTSPGVGRQARHDGQTPADAQDCRAAVLQLAERYLGPGLSGRDCGRWIMMIIVACCYHSCHCCYSA